MPGSIRPHGMMLVVEREGLSVRQAAGDIEGHLGVTGWQDLPLNALIGEVVLGSRCFLCDDQRVSGWAPRTRDCAMIPARHLNF
jgi:light-regulated signal transduction histidine kinase (bacteriophytochrome)